MANICSLFELVEKLLTEEGFETERVRDDLPPGITETVTTLKMGIAGKSGDWRCRIRIFEQTQRIVVYSIFPLKVRESDIVDGSLLLTQINYGLLYGNFELDMGDGEVRYKTSIDCESITVTMPVLMNLMFGNFFSMDLYYPVIQAFIEGQADAIQLLENIDFQPAGHRFDLLDTKVH